MSPTHSRLLRQITVVLFAAIVPLSASSAGKPRAQPVQKSKADEADSNNKSEALQGKENAVINPETFDARLVSRLVFDLTNSERLHNGLYRFDESTELQRPATLHSADMATRDYFSHNTKGLFTGSSFAERMRSFDIQAGMTAENIAMLPCVRGWVRRTGPQGTSTEVYGQTYGGLARETVKEWMESPGHRRNILNPDLDLLGVGCAVGMHGGTAYVYLTQDFADSR